MKKILLLITLFVLGVSGNSQHIKKYYERLNANGTIDSGYVKLFTDSVFDYNGDAFVSFTADHYTRIFGAELPNNFGNFRMSADGVYRNFSQRTQGVDWAGINNNPATTVGNNFYTLANPASPSLARINANGTVVTRTVSEVKTDLGIENIDNTSDANKPVSTATNTALGLKQDISTNNGGWTTLRVSGSNATTTGQSLVDITGLVSGTLTNSTKYEIEVLLDVGSSAVTTGCQYGIFGGGTGGAAVVSAILQGTTTVNAITQVTLSAPGVAQGTFLTTSGTNGTIRIHGWITTRGTGTATISIQHLKVTSGTSTVRTGSVFRYRLAQ